MTTFAPSINYYLFGLMVFLAVASLLALIYGLAPSVPKENRAYMDPLPPLLRPFWPIVQVIAYYLCSRLSARMLSGTEARLVHNGAGYLFHAEQFMALRLLGGLTGFMLAFGAATAGHSHHDMAIALVGLIMGLVLPDVWLRDMRHRRVTEVMRMLPVYLDFITLAVEAGLNFQGGIQQAVQRGPVGILRNELNVVLRDIRSGLTRAEALRRMDRRLSIPDVTSFVSAVIQAERMGAGMAGVMRVQSEQRRKERFQYAEKKAMEAPIKLIGPLILFIFPVTFLVLAFPIMVRLFMQGLL
jgi:tight adherence protein C